MNIELATKQTSMDKQSLILPNKREALLMRLNEFRTNNLNAKDLEDYNILRRKTYILFIQLCWSKLGISVEQLRKLNQQDLNELAVIIYEKTKILAFVQTIFLACLSVILVCVPFIGWKALARMSGTLSDMSNNNPVFYPNMLYYYWYRRMKNKYGQVFNPTTKDEE